MYADGDYEAAITRRLGQIAVLRAEGRRGEAEPRQSKDDSHVNEQSQRSGAGNTAKQLQPGVKIRRRVGRPPRQSISRDRSPETATGASRSLTQRRRALSTSSLNESFDRNSSRSDWLLKPQDRDAASERHGSPPSGSRGRSRESAYYTRAASRSRSRETGIVQTAARLAATAAATAAAAAASAEGSAQIGRVFIPSSPATNREFNVVASVSKAARSARELNATLASKVKSLDFDGAGPLFSDIERIGLSDMHDYLNSVKELRHSGGYN